MKLRCIVALSALVTLVHAGCTEPYCESDGDCAYGSRCNTETNKCFGLDASVAYPVDGTTGADVEVDGDAEPELCTGAGSCTADVDEPICDDTSFECRACADDGDCIAQLPTTSVCAGSGACVECEHSADDCTADVAEPICDAVAFECRDCLDDNDCATHLPGLGRPACVDTGVGAGACVECTDSEVHCLAASPICDGNQCRLCRSHAECDFAGGLCDFGSGQCIPEVEIIYVAEATCPGTGDGSRGDPFCSLQDGVDAVTTGQPTVSVADGTYDPITVSTGPSARIIGLSHAAEILASFTPNSAVSLSGASTDLTIESMTLRGEGGTGLGVECVGGPTTHPSVTLSRNEILGNGGGGVYLAQCNYAITNNIIAGNGSGSSIVGGVFISQPNGSVVFHSNTITGNTLNGTTASAGVQCETAGTAVGNTIGWDNKNDEFSADCVTTFCWDGDSLGDPLLHATTFRLEAGSPCRDIGDPAVLDWDVDLDPRPLGSGPDMGADEVP